MKFLLLLLVALAVGLGVYYVMFSDSAGLQTQTQEETNAAQDAADAYRQNQENLMQQLQQ